MAGKIPLFERTEVGPTRAGTVKPGLNLARGAGISEIGAATAKFAGAIFDRVVKTTAANEKATFRSGIVTAMGKYDTFVKANPGASYEELEKERDKMMAGLDKLGQQATTRDAQLNNKLWLATKKADIFASTQTAMEATRSKQALLTYSSLQKVNMANFDEVNYIKLQEDMFKENLIDETVGLAQRELDFAIMDAAEEKVNLARARESVTAEFQAVIDNGGTKEDAKAVVAAAAESGIIPATMRGTLENNVDSFIAGKRKKAEDAVKLTTTETYESFVVPIVGSDLTFDDIEQSKLLKDEKESWQTYIQGSYEDAPDSTSNKGLSGAFNAVYDAQTLQLSKKEAYDALLDARFIKRSITNDRFNWGIDKIQNPYPENMIESIKSTLADNEKGHNRFFKLDAERNLKTNEAFISWIDDQISKGRTDIPPKEMYNMSSQFRVGNDRLVDIGQTIEQGGRTWEVVSFDDNGEALYEEE